MKIAIGSDHAGYSLKVILHKWLLEVGHEVVDVGTDSESPVDYPSYSAAVGRLVVAGGSQKGVVLGGSGQGEQIAANKIKGIRAALCNDLYTAHMARLHNDANIITMGARIVAPQLAIEILTVFLTTTFEGGRHVSRIEQISALEN